MQLTTIALATILISSLATGSETANFFNTKAMFQGIESNAKALAEEEARFRLKKPSTTKLGSTPPASKPTPPKSPVKTYPSSKVSETTAVRSTSTPAKESTTTFRTAPFSSSTGLPASTPVKPPASQPTTSPLKSGSGEKPHVSKVAGLRGRWEPASTSESTPAPKPVRTHPSPPAKGPTATPHTEPTPSSRASPASEPIEPTVSQPTKPLKSAPILLPSGPPLGTPDAYREQSRVAGLMEKFQPLHSSTLPPKLASGTLPKSSGAPKASSIPEDKEFGNFKKAIEQGNYSDAMRIVEELPKEKSREPYGRHLASLDVSKILEMMATYTEKTLSEITDDGLGENPYPNPYPKITSGLFLLYASDDKSTKLLKSLGTEVGDDALLFSMEHGIALLPEGFIKLFKKISEEKRSDALESIAKCTYKYGKYNVFDDIIATLHTEGLLDEGLMNFAANAAFLEVCRHNNLARAQAVYKGATIIPMMYGKAMYVSCRGPRDNNDVFNWLLSNACADDVLCANFSLGEKNEHFKRVGAILAEKFMKTRHKTRYVKRLA